MTKELTETEENKNGRSNSNSNPGGNPDGPDTSPDNGVSSGGDESETRPATIEPRIERTDGNAGTETKRDSEMDLRGTETSDTRSDDSSGTSGGSHRGTSGINRGLSRSNRGGTGTTRRDSSRTGTSGTRGAGTSDKQTSSVVVVDEPSIPSVLKPKEQGSPRPTKSTPTSQSARSKAKGKAGDIDDSEMSMFIEGVFSLLGSMLGPHWFITKDDAEQISVPLVKMLNKQNKKRKDKVNDMMLPMLLMTAIASIVIPRILIQTEEWKVKRYARKLEEQKRANSAGGQALDKLRPGSHSGETSISSRGMAPETPEPTFGNETGGHDVKESNQYVPSLPPSLIGLSD